MYDLNIRVKGSSNERQRVSLLKRAYAFGWNSIAWSYSGVGKAFITENKSKTFQPVNFVISGDDELSQLSSFIQSKNAETFASTGSTLRQLSRLTIIIDEINDAHFLHSTNHKLSRFDIIGIVPGNAKVFTYLCQTADIDLICFDFTHKLPFGLNKKLIDEAIMRGIQFEILYSPIVASSSQVRREVLSNTRVLVQYLSGRHIVLSSGADSIAQLRSPLDVSTIGEMLGLSKEKAMKAIHENPALAIKHAASRKQIDNPIELMSKDQFYAKYYELQQTLSQSSQRERQRDLALISNETKVPNDVTVDVGMGEINCKGENITDSALKDDSVETLNTDAYREQEREMNICDEKVDSDIDLGKEPGDVEASDDEDFIRLDSTCYTETPRIKFGEDEGNYEDDGIDTEIENKSFKDAEMSQYSASIQSKIDTVPLNKSSKSNSTIEFSSAHISASSSYSHSKGISKKSVFAARLLVDRNQNSVTSDKVSVASRATGSLTQKKGVKKSRPPLKQFFKFNKR